MREYVGEDNDPPCPGHAASGHSRFAGALHRHSHRELAGAMPLWLAPVQAVVLNISEKQADYAEVLQKLRNAGLRAEAICATRKLPIKYANIA
jgi:threonyl-tRNA synthetase